MRRRDRGEPGVALRASLAVLLAAVATAVGSAMLNAPPSAGLAAAVGEHLERSGVGNPVTAVLLNFRGYDTLLELAVLTAALVGVWAQRPRGRISVQSPSPVLLGLTSILAPVIPVVCAYLVWAGADRAGGAFQSGAVLASLGVLLVLSDRWRLRPPGTAFRWATILGLATFLAVGLGTLVGRGLFLAYPPQWAKALIFLVEAVAALSIAAVLTGLFLGGPPLDKR